MYQEGSSLSAIARIFGVSVQAVSQWVKRGPAARPRMRRQGKKRTAGAASGMMCRSGRRWCRSRTAADGQSNLTTRHKAQVVRPSLVPATAKPGPDDSRASSGVMVSSSRGWSRMLLSAAVVGVMPVSWPAIWRRVEMCRPIADCDAGVDDAFVFTYSFSRSRNLKLDCVPPTRRIARGCIPHQAVVVSAVGRSADSRRRSSGVMAPWSM